jgi:hypothetical protein
MAEANGIELDGDQARAIGKIMAGYAKGRLEVKEVPVTRRKTKAKGRYQSYDVKCYPLSMTSNFISAYKAING